MRQHNIQASCNPLSVLLLRAKRGSSIDACMPKDSRKLAVQVSAAASIFAVAALMISLRRPDQILHPEVWNEDGLFIIPQTVRGGFLSVFHPVNGYLIVPSRLIAWLSLNAPLEYYPAISTLLGVLAQAACVVAVALAPTMLRWPLLCAALTLCLPMNPEVYVLPQYTFWWTTLLLFLGLLWRPSTRQLLRNAFIVIGGLSSPIILVLSPLFLFRLAYTRRREDALATAVACGVSAVQLYFILVGDPAQTTPFHLSILVQIPLKFFGGWTVFSKGSLIIGFAVFALLCFGLFDRSRENRLPYLLMSMMLAGTIAASVVRAPLEIASPVGDGPRYFFLPLVLISWMLVQLLEKRNRLSIVAAIVVALAAPVSFANFSRFQEHLRSWGDAVATCRVNGADMPIQHDGYRANQQHVGYAADICR